MPEYLELLPPDRALEIFLENIPEKSIGVEEIPISEALDRVVAEAIRSPEMLPAFNRSAVDGYAVRASDTFGASETLPVYLRMAGEIPMGKAAPSSIVPLEAWLIHTGGMLPEGADAVVMLEYTQVSRPDEIEVQRAAASGENVILCGEDINIGDELVPKGKVIRLAEIGGLLALGITRLTVVRRPIFGVLSSGDELINPGNPVFPGQIRDINSYTLAGLINQHGGKAVLLGIVPDRMEPLLAMINKGLESCDLVVITAGSSASVRDLTSQAINQAGAPGVLVHGVNVKPGKPTILAVCNGKPVIGLPGNPVSALVIGSLFIMPVLDKLQGRKTLSNVMSISARLTASVASQSGRVDYVPVKLVKTQLGWAAEPIFYKSNLIFSLVRADGLVCIPAADTGLAAGSLVEVRPL